MQRASLLALCLIPSLALAAPPPGTDLNGANKQVVAVCLGAVGILLLYLGLIKANSVPQKVVVSLIGMGIISYAVLIFLAQPLPF